MRDEGDGGAGGGVDRVLAAIQAIPEVDFSAVLQAGARVRGGCAYISCPHLRAWVLRRRMPLPAWLHLDALSIVISMVTIVEYRVAFRQTWPQERSRLVGTC